MNVLEVDLGGTSLYEAAGIHLLTSEDARSGKMAQKAAAMFRPSEFDLYADIYLADFRVEKYLRTSEALSMGYNHWVMSFPESQDVAEMVETHMHHGWSHFRRVLKYFNEEFARTPLMRNDWNFIRFAPAAYLAIRHHDLPEMYTGLKEHHDGAGALFAHGMMGMAYEKINEILLDLGGVDFLSKEEWGKQRAAATFICLYHSKPETMPSVDEIMNQGGILFGVFCQDGTKPFLL